MYRIRRRRIKMFWTEWKIKLKNAFRTKLEFNTNSYKKTFKTHHFFICLSNCDNIISLLNNLSKISKIKIGL